MIKYITGKNGGGFFIYKLDTDKNAPIDVVGLCSYIKEVSEQCYDNIKREFPSSERFK